jgi:hypothetical protein
MARSDIFSDCIQDQRVVEVIDDADGLNLRVFNFDDMLSRQGVTKFDDDFPTLLVSARKNHVVCNSLLLQLFADLLVTDLVEKLRQLRIR